MPPSSPHWLSRLIGAPGASSFREFAKPVREAAQLSPVVAALSDPDLRDRAHELGRATAPRHRRELPELLALLRETSTRALGITPFDEQLLACCALLAGNAVDMATGEGKTIVGALAAAGHALAGRQVHVISVNDYLAERDAEWMRPLFTLLGIDVAWIGQHTPFAERRTAYALDIVYAPVSEIGFDVLRDRFAVTPAERVDPAHDVAIVDEADSVMIDEALTPLVLAGTSDLPIDQLDRATLLVEALEPGLHYDVSGDGATVTLSDTGLDHLEAQLGGINLYAAAELTLLTQLNLALHARELLQRDVDYLVRDGAVQLINARRGRVAHLQRWPDGLQAAIEAKERLAASASGVILDSITVQDLLLRYESRSGMSGTVSEVVDELLEFYDLPAGRIARHTPSIRVDQPDRIFRTDAERVAAAVAEIAARHATGQPVLVGTQSVVASESLSDALRDAGVESRTLNAKNDAEEAAIIARAGELGAVTISTQMSGRGTDIRLGGAAESGATRVAQLGGLAVIGVGRYPTRRLDLQLRGRAGRQGDPGTSIAFVSLDDDLVQRNALPHMLTPIVDGLPLDAAARQRTVDGAQRIAEGARRDRHRATWIYTRAIAAQRDSVLRYREEVSRSDRGTAAVLDRIPARLTQGDAQAPLADTIRAATLFFLDEQWSDHLANLQEIRDGIHLRALAGQVPSDEFHRIALREFQGFTQTVADRTVEFIATLNPADLGSDVAGLGLHRPATTWTYMVTDDPFGAPGDRFARNLGRWYRGKVLKIE